MQPQMTAQWVALLSCVCWKKSTVIHIIIYFNLWSKPCLSSLRGKRIQSILGYLPSGNLFTVSSLTSVALVSTVSVFMMPALAQPAGKQSYSVICTLLESCHSNHRIFHFHRAGNIVLLQFLVGLKQATEDELLAELVVNVLKVSPDILARYLQETQYSYTPRLKTAWQDNVKLLKKVKRLLLSYVCALCELCLFWK